MMRNIIKNILIQEAGKGTWSEPIYSDSPGMVPPQSYPGANYNYNTKIYEKFPITKDLFFKALQLVIKDKDKDWFESNTELTDSLWYRNSEMGSVLKLIGFGSSKSSEGLTSKMFWAAHDNYEGIKTGTITNYDQLELRALVEYKVPLFESAREYKTIYWAPKVECYSRDDAYAEVLYDEDGVYDSWEYDGDPSYQEESDEWDSEGKELDGDIEVVKTVYPAEQGGRDEEATTEPEPRDTYSSGEEITEAFGPSPEENDILDDLDGLIIKWGNSRYGKQLKKVINKYKNLPLNEKHNKKSIK